MNTAGSGLQMQTSGAADHFGKMMKGVGGTKEKSGQDGHEDG